MTETRAEAEAKLKAASDSMSQRLNAMEEEVKLPAKISEVASNKTVRKVAAAVGVGLAVGLLFGGSRSKSASQRALTTLDDWRKDLADAIGDLMQEGFSPREAVRKASRSQPPLVVEQETEEVAKKGILAVALAYALKMGVNMTAKELLKRMMERNEEEQVS